MSVLTLTGSLQTGSVFRGTFDFSEDTFDWGDSYQRPNIPSQDIIVYEMGIRSFTADSSSGVGKDKEGTFNGMLEKVLPIRTCAYTMISALAAMQRECLSSSQPLAPLYPCISDYCILHACFGTPLALA